MVRKLDAQEVYDAAGKTDASFNVEEDGVRDMSDIFYIFYVYLSWWLAGVTVNLVYNIEPFRTSSKGPLEIPTVIAGQALVSVFSSMVNNLPWANFRYWVHLVLIVTRTQLWTEYMDYDADNAKARKTTVCLFSKAKAQALVLSTLVVEFAVVAALFSEDAVLQTFSAFGVVMYALVEYSPEAWGLRTVKTQKKVMIGQSAGGLLLIGHIWLAGLFVD